MSFGPLIRRAQTIQHVQLGAYTAAFMEDIEAAGPIQYRYVVAVSKRGSEQPSYFVTSEVNAMAEVLGGGSHFLCDFDECIHHNYSCSDEWADREKFITEALRRIRKKFGIQK